MKLHLPYGRGEISCELPGERVCAVLESKLEEYNPAGTPQILVEEAMRQPIGTKPLHVLAEGCENVVIIASDHTRPVPSQWIIPPMLREIRRGSPAAKITIVVATGCHREMTAQEMEGKFGRALVEAETILVHNCDDEKNLVSIGTLPSGGELMINRTVAEADLLVSEGFIEPHFFAGFSGGRKSVMPGVASRRTVLANHCAAFIAHPNARTGILHENPIHRDMLWAAQKAKLAFIVNVVLNGKKEPVFAVAGDVEEAHLAGCAFLQAHCGVTAPLADIVITTNGGYPLDQNIYQAAKGINTAESAVKPGGVIIMVAKSQDGHGGEDYYRQLTENADLQGLMERFLQRSAGQTEPDQWQTQLLIRAMLKAKIIYVSDAEEEMVRNMHMLPARSVEQALAMADELLGHSRGSITVMPDGISVMFIANQL